MVVNLYSMMIGIIETFAMKSDSLQKNHDNRKRVNIDVRKIYQTDIADEVSRRRKWIQHMLRHIAVRKLRRSGP